MTANNGLLIVGLALKFAWLAAIVVPVKRGQLLYARARLWLCGVDWRETRP